MVDGELRQTQMTAALENGVTIILTVIGGENYHLLIDVN